MSIVILGDGLLGSEIRKQTNWDYISRKKDIFDFGNINSYTYLISKYDQLLNCIGNTDTYSKDRKMHWDINFKGVCDLVDWCNLTHKKIIHISTDYIYSGSNPEASENEVPVHCNNWYSYTKLLADGYIQLRAKDYLIIRTSFKPCPFPYDKAILQWGNFDYVDVIASKIIKIINKNGYGVFNVGTKTKSMGELASKTKPNIIRTREKIDLSMPTDVSMNIKKMENFLNEKN